LACSIQFAVFAVTKSFNVKFCRYLHAYEDFNRKLGCTLVSISQPDRSRYTHNSRGTPGRRPSMLKDDAAASAKPSVDVKPSTDVKPSIDIKEEVRLVLLK